MPISSEVSPCPTDIILWGGTGQAKVLHPIIEDAGARVLAVFSDVPLPTPPFATVPFIVGRDAFLRWAADRDVGRIGFGVAIGNPNGGARLSLHEWLCSLGFVSVSFTHATAWVAPNAEIGAGAQIMAGAIIQPEVRIGRQCIVNTRASVDHECIVGDGVEIAPGATICGSVHIGARAWVCAGAVVKPFLSIGEDAVVGAGAAVIRDVPAATTVAGVPARPIATGTTR